LLVRYFIFGISVIRYDSPITYIIAHFAKNK
jgi:hypothetical protein